jgi:hypothetical protein
MSQTEHQTEAKSTSQNKCKTPTDVLREELDLIKRARTRLGIADPGKPAEKTLSALCLSGGGIRSAIFCLGGLMALDRGRLIQQFDYLSTVSGGGYIGGWLSKLLKVIGDKDLRPETSIFDCVREKERAATGPPSADRNKYEPAALQFLRENSSYLAPRKGMFSGDTWSLAAIYIRNLLLNWAILLPFLAAVLATPLWVLGLANAVHSPPIVLFLAVFCAMISLIYPTVIPSWDDIARDRVDKRKEEEKTNRETKERLMLLPAFLLFRMLPYVAAVFCFTHWLSLETGQLLAIGRASWNAQCGLGVSLVIGLGFFLPVIILLAWSIKISFRPLGVLEERMSTRSAGVTYLAQSFGALCAVPISTYLVLALPRTGLWFYVWFPFVATAMFLVAGALFAGLVDPLVQDDSREWWARSGGYFILFAVVWVLSGIICVGIPSLLGLVRFIHQPHSSGLYFCPYLAGQINFNSSGALITALASGAIAYLTRVEGQISDTAKLLSIPSELLRKAVFAIAISIFSVALAEGCILLAIKVAAVLMGFGRTLAGALGQGPGNQEIPGIAWWWLLCSALALALTSLLISFPVSVNHFSPHVAYRNRLVRSFLGASNVLRKFNPFTGFSRTDNLPLYLLGYEQLKDEIISDANKRRLPERHHQSQRPFHVMCAAANVAIGERLAWQERKALSFTFSLLHCGGKQLGYRPSREFGGPRGITLGTAIAISGAAANSGMGFYSSPIKSFLLTFLNARLGWWLGNPGREGTWQRESPLVAFSPLLAELFSLTRDDSAWLNVSDGGHYDNTGIYEMLARKCRYIVLFDADSTRDGISNAARRARVDLNADLVLESVGPESFPCDYYKITYHDTENTRAKEGSLIRFYPRLGDPGVWSSFENCSYKEINGSFPDDPLINQFFTETLFESYRNLGLDIVFSSLNDALALRKIGKRKEPTVEDFAHTIRAMAAKPGKQEV